MIFDDNASPCGGANLKVDGDLIIKEQYYPWVDEEFLGEYKKTVSLFGKHDIYLMYQALQAKQIYFQPIVHSSYVLYSAGPRAKGDDNSEIFTYPGEKAAVATNRDPSFSKLEAIRLAAEKQK